MRRAPAAIEAAVLAAGAAVVASRLIAPVLSVFDIVGQLSGPVLFLCGAALLSSLWGRRWRLAAALALAGVALGLALWPQVAARSPTPGQGPSLRVYFNNLWTDNGDGAAIAHSIESSDADVVALVQVSGKNRGFVDKALARYPYKIWAQKVSNAVGRTVIASRYPLIADEPSCSDWRLPPGFEVAVQAPTPVRLIVVHLPRPWPLRRDQLREFRRLARQVKAGGATDRTVVVGDFNATLSSAVQAKLARDTGLHALPAFLGDWPTWFPPIFRIAIENALAGDGLSLGERRLAPFSGSDHQPLVFEVSRARAAGRAGELPAAAGRPACFL